MQVVRALTATLLALCFAALSSGALEHLHNAAHAREDAAMPARGGPDSPTPAPPHNDSNCPTHAQLHLPLLAAGWVPLLICLGLFVAFLTLLAPALPAGHAPARLDCRGPPSC
jgi:hypothetical protein